MKVFISSVIRGFEEYREAAARAAKPLRHEVKRAEDFAASPATPQQACLAGVRWADVVILLLGGRYGDRQASGVSATHEEYREARARSDVLVFVEQGVDFEAAQREFVDEVQAWTTGHYIGRFRGVDQLRDAVTTGLRDLELARVAGPVDEDEMLRRARALLPRDERTLGGALTVIVAGGPRQQVLRPRELEAAELEEAITKDALFGSFRVFDRKSGTRATLREDALVVEQERGGLILLDQLGTIRLTVSTEQTRDRGDFGLAGVAIREDVEELLRGSLRFIGATLDRIDPLHRISDVVPIAGLWGVLTWRTRAEHARNPNSYPVRHSSEAVVVSLTPPRRHRAALVHDTGALAEDFAALFERQMRR